MGLLGTFFGLSVAQYMVLHDKPEIGANGSKAPP
jgi:hypothetical protein